MEYYQRDPGYQFLIHFESDSSSARPENYLRHTKVPLSIGIELLCVADHVQIQ